MILKENLVENNDFTYKLEKIVLSKYDSIEIQNRKNQIDNLKIEDCIFERKGYSIINLMICYTNIMLDTFGLLNLGTMMLMLI